MGKKLVDTIREELLTDEQSPTSVFIDSLEDRLNLAIAQKIQKRSPSTSVWRMLAAKKALLVSVLILVVAGIIAVVSPDSRRGISLAYAMDKIRYSYSQLSSTDSIFHQISILKIYGDNPETVSYEIWEDMESCRFRNIAEYPDEKVYQIHDGEKYWDYDEGDNTLRIEKYTASDSSLLCQKDGTRVIGNLSGYQFLFSTDEKSLEIGEEIVDGESFIVIKSRAEADINETLEIKPETDFNKYYFDKEAFILRRDRYYKITKQGETLEMETVISDIESLSRTEDRMGSLFKFDVVITPDTKVEEVEIPLEEKETETEEENLIDPDNREVEVIDVNTDDQIIPVQPSYESPEFRIKVPAGWQVIDSSVKDTSSSSTPMIVIEKDGYYIEISSELVITGGGFGYPYDGICENYKSYNYTSLSENNFERIDVGLRLEGDVDCSAVNLGIIDSEDSSVIWTGSVIKLSGSANPVISRSELFDGQYAQDEDLILIRYGYKYEETEIDYPTMNSEKLLEMLKEMDAITTSVEFFN